jgi:hypothetical protein
MPVLGYSPASNPKPFADLTLSVLLVPLCLITTLLPQTNTLERRLFYIPSFKIYGSVAGFYDYGPPGCAIKQNLTQVRAAGAADNMIWDTLVAGAAQQAVSARLGQQALGSPACSVSKALGSI